MKFSYNWLGELVPQLDRDPRELMDLITMKTAECEGLEHVGAALAEASPARVLTVEPIADTHNVKATVATERYGDKTVVCGAPNCRAGMVTAYLPLGKKTINGVESDGMLASAAELGISDDHSGIVENWSGDLRLRPDTIFDIDNKSLTHRPDLWGHYGMAREVAAITGRELRDAVTPVEFSGPAPVEVRISDPALCPRYSALVFENVRVGPSPAWLQYRLASVGLNSINNIVDVTNYIMAELAQPMHAFDAAKLHGSTIFVRTAAPGERIMALNDEEYALSESNLVIADAAGPIAIAGVIGGMHSAIGNDTTRIVFESANFNAASVRKTSSALKLRTDASMRFEKAQDPVNTVRALERAVALLQEVSPGIRLVAGLADVAAPRQPAPPIELPIDWLVRKLGRSVEESEVRAILESLGFGVMLVVPGVLSATAPSWRATKDVSIKDDLLDEIGRMLGYGSITPTPPRLPVVPPPANPERSYHRAIRTMAAAQGYTEVFNYSFISAETAEAFGMAPDTHVQVQNPIASDQTLLRRSLVPRMWRNILENSKHLNAFRFFEIGREIHPTADGAQPEEIPHFAAALYAREGDGVAGLFELKRLAECLMRDCRVEPAPALAYEHPERSAIVVWRGAPVARLFELHPRLGIEGRAAVLDIDLAKTARLLTTAPKRYEPLRRYPASAFDLSVVAPLREPAGAIGDRLAALAAGDLIGIEFVRQYTGAPLPDDRKSVSYRITVGAPDRTLSSEEGGAVRERIIAGMRAAGYELRV